MASFDLNSAVSGSWTAPTAMPVGAANPGSDQASRPKMAANANSGNIPPSLLRGDETCGIEAQMIPNELARNFILLTMLASGNLPAFPNSLAPGMHPLLPGLLPPLGLPPQFNGILPHGRNVSPLPQPVMDRSVSTSKSKQRQSVSKNHISRAERKTQTSRSADSFTSSRFTGGKNGSSGDIMQTHLTSTLNSINGGSVSTRLLNVPAASYEASKTRSRPTDLHRNTHRVSAMATSNILASQSPHLPINIPSQATTKSDASSSYVMPANNSTTKRGETPSSKYHVLTPGNYTSSDYPTSQNSSFNEAEAAATLLGMRHGQSTSDVPPESRCIVSPRATSTPLYRGHETATKQRNSIRSLSSSNEEAVDLSTRSRSHTNKGGKATVNMNINSCANNSSCDTITTGESNPSKAINARDRKLNVKASPVKTLPESATGCNDRKNESTSVVSQYRYCICAFDLPAETSSSCNHGNNDFDKACVVHQGIQQQAFNYKKVICEKFSQGSSASTMTYTKGVISKELPVKSNTNPKATEIKVSSRTISPAIIESGVSSSNEPSKKRCARVSDVASCKSRSNVSLSDEPSKNYVMSSSVQKRSNFLVDIDDAKGRSSPPQKQRRKDVSNSAIDNSLSKKASCETTKLESKRDVPSFSDLRQKSSEHDNAMHKNEMVEPIDMLSTKAKHFGVYKAKVPLSNLYRVRNSALGGSNDSLHSISSEKDDAKNESGDESDSSSSSSESECSGEESDVEEIQNEGKSDCNNLSPAKPVEEIQSPTKASPSRSRFVLSQPKFKLGSQDPNTEKNNSGSVEASSVASVNQTSNSIPVQNSMTTSKKQMLSFSDPDLEKNTVETNNIPELKFDGNESENTFKYKFMKALSNPDSKGFAVDGKRLRALLGDEATCFYHNNKKYVLRPSLKPREPKKTSDDIEAVSCSKHSRKDDIENKSSSSPERITQRRIEPRISVTATKRAESPQKSQIRSSIKKMKKAKKRPNDSSKKKGSATDSELRKHVKTSDLNKIKQSMPHNKRRRRNHEIENLVYEGAGGKTPMPDLSLRDSDVFSNIKLRRREAAKRGIVEPKSPKTVKTQDLCRKRIKTAAHNRAIANKNRKKSIEKKLRKYRKKDRFFLVKKDETQQQSEPSRKSCVRINAGISRWPLNEKTSDDKDLSTDVGTPLYETAERDICTATQERKRKLPVQINNHLANEETGRKNTDDRRDGTSTKVNQTVFLAAQSTHKPVVSVTNAKIGNRNEADHMDYSTYNRRSSRRISSRKRQADNSSNEKKKDDDMVSISSTNFETDSVRSDSPLPTHTRNKSRKSHSNSSKTRRTIARAKTSRHEKQCNFSLMSCFPTESAITLTAAFGDLTPSYSMKVTKKNGLSFPSGKWNIGASALTTKQQLQRETWRNMTLDMFTNGH